jgi:phenylalanyl-tRNA synthetase beta chain
MPTVKLNKKAFEELVGKKMPIEELKDRISMLGTDLESIDGNEISVEIFPNRPDLLSEQGFARAFSSFIGVKTGLKEYKVKPSGEKLFIDESVNSVRPHTACALVKGIKFDDEKIKQVIQIQEKLHVTYGRNRKKVAIGVYPLDKIKFPVTFFAEDPSKIKFLPLESKVEMTGLQVLSKHATGRDYAHLLEGNKVFPFFKDANNEILSMPPIINSHNVGKVEEGTSDLFVECSGFDFKYLETCLNMVVTALADMGGKIYSIELNYKDKKVICPTLEPVPMKIDLNYVNKILGLEIKEKDMKTLLEKMGHGYKDGKALIPAFRSDLIHPVDLIEDIAIAYGYENFEPEIPDVSTIGKEDEFEKFKTKVANILIGLKLIETKTYHLTNNNNQNVKMLTDYPLVELKSAINNEYNILRHWLTPSLMEILNKNLNKEYPQNIFGIGTGFYIDPKEETGIREKEKLSVVLCNENTDFTEIKKYLDYLMRMLDVKYEIKDHEQPSCIPGRCGSINVKGQSIGMMGESHPQVLENWQVLVPVSAFEIDLTALFKILKE